jgi:hypothetical protein
LVGEHAVASVIHIHNGDVVATRAKRAGLEGEHLAFRESLVTGPVVPGEQWMETRAQAIASGHDVDILRVRTDLLEQEQALDAARTHNEIVLWFEHDLFCLIHLIYLLQRFGDRRLSLVWCPTPLSHQEERDLHLLFDSRAAVTPSMMTAAREAWAAYIAETPAGINTLLERDTHDFPFLKEGLALHASRFPAPQSGLGAIEQQALALIGGGVGDFKALFPRISMKYGFGDSEVFRHLRMMSERAVPLITVEGDPPNAAFTITPAGENVLRGDVDDCAINDPDLWLGGVHLTKENLWRWNGARLLPSRPAVS